MSRWYTLLLFNAVMSYNEGQSSFSDNIWAASLNCFKAWISSNIHGNIICGSKVHPIFFYQYVSKAASKEQGSMVDLVHNIGWNCLENKSLLWGERINYINLKAYTITVAWPPAIQVNIRKKWNNIGYSKVNILKVSYPQISIDPCNIRMTEQKFQNCSITNSIEIE